MQTIHGSTVDQFSRLAKKITTSTPKRGI